MMNGDGPRWGDAQGGEVVKGRDTADEQALNQTTAALLEDRCYALWTRSSTNAKETIAPAPSAPLGASRCLPLTWQQPTLRRSLARIRECAEWGEIHWRLGHLRRAGCSRSHCLDKVWQIRRRLEWHIHAWLHESTWSLVACGRQFSPVCRRTDGTVQRLQTALEVSDPDQRGVSDERGWAANGSVSSRSNAEKLRATPPLSCVADERRYRYLWTPRRIDSGSARWRWQSSCRARTNGSVPIEDGSARRRSQRTEYNRQLIQEN
jgi:hypothetical protein